MSSILKKRWKKVCDPQSGWIWIQFGSGSDRQFLKEIVVKKTTNLTAEHGERLSRPGGPVGKHAAVVALEHGVNKILKDRKSGMLQQVIHDSTSTKSYNYSGLNYY